MSFKYSDVEHIFKKISSWKNSEKNASYIPYLKNIDPSIYAISICNIKGEVMNFGDFKTKISIQSVSKVFTLALALENHNIKHLQDKVGNSKGINGFNSIEDVVQIHNHTINSFVNAGAMATTSLLYDDALSVKENRRKMENDILTNMENFAGRKLHVNKKLYLSQTKTWKTNKEILKKLISFNRLYGDHDVVLDVYTKQCSVMVNSEDVAIMAATLASDGVNPITKKRVVSKLNTDYIVEHMADHGLYNESNDWWKETYLPAKSGVAGIIMIVIPGVMGICISSPPLNKYGNSYKGIKTGKLLANIPIYS
jgi:glutaminase